MEREIIESMVASLPHSEMGMVQDDHEVWEETDGDAYFTVTRHWLTISAIGEKREIVALTVSGPPAERRRIIAEFVEVFGASTQSDRGAQTESEPDTILWVIN